MLREDKGKGVYRRRIEADLNVAFPFEDATYAAAVSTGKFTLGHMGPDPSIGVIGVVEQSTGGSSRAAKRARRRPSFERSSSVHVH